MGAGRYAKFATTMISDALFVGNAFDEILTPENCNGNCKGAGPEGSYETGFFYSSNGDKGNGWTTGINMPGIG